MPRMSAIVSNFYFTTETRRTQRLTTTEHEMKCSGAFPLTTGFWELPICVCRAIAKRRRIHLWLKCLSFSLICGHRSLVGNPNCGKTVLVALGWLIGEGSVCEADITGIERRNSVGPVGFDGAVFPGDHGAFDGLGADIVLFQCATGECDFGLISPYH